MLPQCILREHANKLVSAVRTLEAGEHPGLSKMNQLTRHQVREHGARVLLSLSCFLSSPERGIFHTQCWSEMNQI